MAVSRCMGGGGGGTLKLSQIMPPPTGAFPVYTTPPAAQPAPVQEPVAWMDALGDIYKHELWPDWNPPHTLLYATPPAAQRQRLVFPTMLRKMWSGSEVQAWLDENVNKENT